MYPLYVSTFEVEQMSVLDQKRIDETEIWVEHKLETYSEHGQSISKFGPARSKPNSKMV